MRIPPEVQRALGFYVYLLIDPRDDRIFYVGKGKNERPLDHVSDPQASRKKQVLDELAALGREPRIEVLAHQLPDEETAFRIEAAVIDVLGLASLTNAVRGWNSVRYGRLSLSELITYYAAPSAAIVDPVLLIRINRLYRHNMTPLELYEATRGVWKLGARRLAARFACAVFESVVREVFQIDSWAAAGTTPYSTRPLEDVRVEGRWEFVGAVAPQEVRNRYLHRSVASYLTPGAQSPITYVNA